MLPMLSQIGPARLALVCTALVLTTSCQLTRDYSATPLAEDGAGPTGKQDCAESPVTTSVFYVSPQGSSSADGTRDSPWDPDTAQANVRAGDTLLFLPGTYRMSFAPSASGRADAPIVLRSERRHEAKMAGENGNSVSFRLEGNSHVRVEGFAFVSGDSRWILVDDSDHIVLSDLWLEDHDGVGRPMKVSNSQHIALVDSVARKSSKYILAGFDNVRFLRIAGNSFSMNHSYPLVVENSTDVVVRANLFHNKIGRAALFRGNHNILLEDNIWTNAIEGPATPVSYAEVEGMQIIFRHNRVFRNWGVPLAFNLDASSRSVEKVRVYHNVIDDTRDESAGGGEGWSVSAPSGVLSDAIFKNNIFSNNGAASDHVQFTGRSWGGELSLISNAFWAGDANPPSVLVDDSSYTLAEAAQSHPEAFVDNVVSDPKYRDGENYDHRLRADSALLDTGQPLTTARSDGSGVSLPVEDAGYFFDGFGIETEVGDMIAVGTPTNTARIIQVDYATDTLILDRDDLSWSRGDSVHLPWSGPAPDIGVWEEGPDARATIAIDHSAFVTQAGEPITLRPQLSGDIDAASFEWRLGDGELTCGRSFEHIYREPGDYPVRLKVTGKNGQVWRSAAYLLVDGDGVDVDSLTYNEQLMDDYLCDGEPRSYTNNEPGRDTLVEDSDQGYECVR